MLSAISLSQSLHVLISGRILIALLSQSISKSVSVVILNFLLKLTGITIRPSLSIFAFFIYASLKIVSNVHIRSSASLYVKWLYDI